MAAVSIVVPVYNAGEYLRECMDSLVRQTLRDIEIICVNDGSTDGSEKILREYAEKDSRVTVISQENGGYGKAMNAGVDLARGEYLGIAEPDDYVALTMYEDLYNIAVAQGLDFVKADYLRFTTHEGGETRTYRHIHLSDKRADYGQVFRPRDEKDSFFFVMNTWAGIYRMDWLRKHGIRHRETPGAAFQDNGFWFQTFLYADRAMILDTPYYRVRRDNPNSSVRDPGKAYAINGEFDAIREILEKDPAVWEDMKQVYWRQRIRNCGATLNRIAPELRGEYIETVSAEMKKGLTAGEFDPAAFPTEDRQLTERLMSKHFRAQRQEMDELEKLKQSSSYRAGQVVTWLPRKIRNALHSSKAEGEKA